MYYKIIESGENIEHYIVISMFDPIDFSKISVTYDGYKYLFMKTQDEETYFYYTKIEHYITNLLNQLKYKQLEEIKQLLL